MRQEIIRSSGQPDVSAFSLLGRNSVKTLAQPDTRLPLYQQLKEMFLDEISSGGWKIGTHDSF